MISSQETNTVAKPSDTMIGSPNFSSEDKCVFRRARRYSKAEEAMHEDDRPLQKGEERRFSSTESSTVVTAPYIWVHSVKEAEKQLHLISRMREESVSRQSRRDEKTRRTSTDSQEAEDERKGRRSRSVSFGDGGFGDCASTNWDWPLGEHGEITVRSKEKEFLAWIDFRPFQPNEVCAKVMGNTLMIQCKSKRHIPGSPNELFRTYTLPMNCDARTSRFWIKNGHILAVKVDKDQPIKLAVADFPSEQIAKANEKRK